MLGSSLVAAQLTAFQEGLNSIKLVTELNDIYILGYVKMSCTKAHFEKID
jgi:hypothetical protein